MERSKWTRVISAAGVRAEVVDMSASMHLRVNHWKLFTDRQKHINGIENFWNQAKRHMRKFNGVPKAQFGLYLKECE